MPFFTILSEVEYIFPCWTGLSDFLRQRRSILTCIKERLKRANMSLLSKVPALLILVAFVIVSYFIYPSVSTLDSRTISFFSIVGSIAFLLTLIFIIIQITSLRNPGGHEDGRYRYDMFTVEPHQLFSPEGGQEIRPD